MSLWASTKDKHDECCQHCCRKRLDVKRKKASDKIAKMKDGLRKSKKRAKKSGITHETVIAMKDACDNFLGVVDGASDNVAMPGKLQSLAEPFNRVFHNCQINFEHFLRARPAF